MAEDQWLLKEDGYLNVDCESSKIIYVSNLNIIIVFSNQNSEIKILDVNSGVVLQSVTITDGSKKAQGKYLNEQDKIIFWDEKNLGLRGDYNGVLLLDTILQTPVSHTEELVKIELLLSEAVLFLQSLQSLEQQGVENSTDVINELTLKIGEAHSKSKKGIKAQKWETVCLELPHSSLKVVASSMVVELKRLQRHIPALAIASAVNERLTDLIVGARIIENDTTQRFHMFSEAARRKSFEQWPHMDYKWALPDQMAQAGFYHQPSDSGDDRAMCFTCNVCLVCWEKTDEPWSEHERHSPECPFVKGEYTQNVPLSVTYATSPAVSTSGFNIMSTGDQGNIICVGNQETGEIAVWNVERQLKNCATFNIKSCEKDIVKKFDLEQDVDLELSALCTFKKHTVLVKSAGKFGTIEKGTEVFGTRIIAGIKIKNREGVAFQADGDNKLALVLYAVTETAKTTKSTVATANGNNSGITNSASTQKDPLASISISNILSNPKPPLDTIEERLEDDFLKFFDTDSLTMPKNKTVSDAMKAAAQADYLFSVKKKMQAGKFNDTSTASGAAKVAEENDDVICTAIQTISIVPFLFVDYEIYEMLPSFDNRYLLVVLKRTGIKIPSNENQENLETPMETEESTAYSNVVEDANRNVQLILFSIEDNGLINEVPISVRILEDKDTPVEICMLPKFDTSGRLFSGSPTDSEKGVFVITSVDGSIKILSLTTLKTLSEARVDGQKFISSVYCKNLERLCGCTDKGSLHFYSFYDLDVDSSDEYDEEAETVDKGKVKDEFTQFDNATPSTSSNFMKKEEEKRVNSELIAYKKQLTINDLKTLYSLTLFDEMLTPYSAEVPGCWSELVQAQKQRRNPQHLRPGDDTHLTRTWRLHNDATTWDEHLIELSLPKTTSLGHIDFKFSLYQPCINPPAIQVTLLKQKSIGLCCRRKSSKEGGSGNLNKSSSSCDVDDNIDFNINASSSSSTVFNSIENPVLSEEYLQARNAEILAGPVELSSCMDLSDQGGMLTLVSPKLLKSKARNYLLHIKTMTDLSKEGHGKTRVPVRKKGLTSILLTSFASSSVKEAVKDRATYQDANLNKINSNDYYIGCDWLHEISITVRATREVPNLTNERLQRLAMLESNLLIKNLLDIARNKEQCLIQNLALDILNWILMVRLSRYRCPRNVFHMKYTNKQMESVGDVASADVNLQQSECVRIMGNNLNELIQSCILLNNRSVAHKCVKLLITCLNGAQTMMDQKQSYTFEVALKNGILESIPFMVNSNYAGSLRWFSILIAGTSSAESQGIISTSLMKLLIEVLQEISNRPNSMNSLLQARFGLYSTPFESELFDSDLTALNKNNFSVFYASVLKAAGSGSGQQQQNQLSDLKSFCVQDGSGLRIPMQLRRKSISAHFKGLLEVEPIHYTCCSTSEATRIESMDSASMQSVNIIDDILIEAPSNTSVIKLGSGVIKVPNDKDAKKTEEDLNKLDIGIANNVKNILVDKIFYSHIKKHKLKDFEDKLLASVKSEEKNLSTLGGMSMFGTDDSTSDSGWGPGSGGMLIYGGETMRNAEDGTEEIFDSSKVASVASFSNKIKDFIEQTNKEENSTILPWHKLLSAPMKHQMIVVDRMHSGARRQVTLDFGYPVLLTDVIIPSCADLASLTLDIWCFEEETDSVRLAVSQDIGMKYLILSDLQPPPVCRYVKITFTGRYGMSATRCKIPMGSFYGHVIILDKDSYADPVMKYVKNKKNHIKNQLKVLNALYEDTHCRYCLSSSKLAELLQPLLKSENSNMAHMQSYLNRMKESEEQCTEFSKICSIYEECIAFQNQLNIVKNVIKRLESVSVPEQPLPPEIPLKSLCTDKLRVLSECLIESLLHFIINYGVQNVSAIHSYFDLKTCNLLFKSLVVRGDSHLQLATCSLLVRMCCFQPWWGDFFANTFTTLFSSQNCEIFPQDRVFFLLTYLGRKSIYMGTCRTIVIDAILKTIASLLAPLSSSFDSRLGVWRNTDLILLSWLLLFLSVCLHDNSEKKENSNPRWDFMSGEADMVKARLSMNNNNSRTFSRSFKKRFLQNKQSSNNIAEKFYMMSDGSFSNSQSSLAQIEQQMKQEVKKYQNSVKNLPYDCLNEFGKNIKKMSDTANKCRSSSSTLNTDSGCSSKNEMTCDNLPDTAFDRGLKSIRAQNMLVVIRGLIGLLLRMDFTCNMDLFLLTCKIIARLVNACPSISLPSIMTTSQLLQLIRIAVWENQQHPWTVHAITCLLQDILEADKNSKLAGSNCPDESVSMDVDSNISLDNDVQRTNDFSASVQNPMQNVINKYAEAVKFQLPSLMECEDAEMEDILDDILEQAKKFTSSTKKDYNAPTPPARNSLNVSFRSRVSSTMDARLEYGLDTNIEMLLRRLTLKSSINLFASLPQVGNKDSVNVVHEIPPWPENILNVWSGSEYQHSLDTNRMLMDVFENIFMDLHLQDSWMNLEQVLQLWLSLNGEVIDAAGNCSFNTGKLPKIPFGEKAIYGLLKALATHPTIQIRGWCLGFQCLIYASKPIANADAEFIQSYYGSNENYMKKIGSYIVDNENFERMLLRFLSENDKNNSLNTNRYAGPTICRLMIQLFLHLQKNCNAALKLKEITLRVLLHLIQYDGAITKQQGPIDAQSKFILEILKYNFLKTDLCVAMSIIESVSHLVYGNITNDEKISCQKSSESNNTTNNVFGSLFATVLGSETSQSKTVTDTTLLVNLLKLSSILVQTKVQQPVDENASGNEASSTMNESQTDEIKAEQQNSEPGARPRPTITFADQVLQHYPSMSKLLGTLSHCSNSSFAMFVISSMYSPMNNESKNTLSDPQNVADALFQLLIYLNKLASEPVLVIRPLFDYLNFVSNARHAMPKLQLSEPFLWFILKVLESPYAVEIFCEMGGIKILAENLVRSNRTLVNMQPNLVTMIMQHYSKSQNNSSLSGATKKTSTATSTTSSTKNEEGLINFAPYCTISSENPSAQPADVLIQGPVPSHRRARTPAWSYLFYPHESHVDLTISLPTAILLKEIQLQPHLSTLASCPSAVAIEITRDPNLGPIPITQPIYTVGMTCIRLKFTQPEIATHIIVRLYRPKDSASIGLTQISVLGTTIFSDIGNGGMKGGPSSGNSFNNSLSGEIVNEDDSLTKTSLGWLRILAQCFNAATFAYDVDQNLSNMVISSASEVNGFLEACCSLLNIAPSTPNFSLQNLETVLLKLGLHSKELGLKLIDILLNESIPQMYKMCNESISDLLYQLSTTADNYSRDRIQYMLNWLQKLRAENGDNFSTRQIVNPNSGYIKCLASILWQAYATNLIIDLPSMITLELFEILYKWLLEVPDKSPTKTAIDAMLCSVCCIRPEFFTLLLKKMHVLVPNCSNDLSACISDDRKDNESMTDDNKQEEYNSEEWYGHYTIQNLVSLDLSESQLDTVAMACQSPLAIYQLIDSGLPNLFTSAILEFCHRMSNKENKDNSKDQKMEEDRCLTDMDKVNISNNSIYPMVNVIKITKILDFLSQICTEGHMRDWLGSYEGSVFWEPLLTLLCNNKLQTSFLEDESTNQPYLELEETVIKFLSNVTACHPKNQDTLTTNLISVIRTTERNNYNININNVLNKNFDGFSSPLNMKYSISGFTRRLVLQILLESEKIAISVRSDLPLQKKENNITLISNHPSKKSNSHHVLFYTSINTRCQDILENCVSAYNNLIPSMNMENRQSDVLSSNSDSSRSDPRKDKDLWDWGLGMNLGMEFLSVAAGVTAKDKRLKEVKNQANSLKTKDLFSVFKLKPDEMKNLSNLQECAQLIHPACPEIFISSDATIAQILTMIKTAGLSLSTPCINLNLIQTKSVPDDMNCEHAMKASDFVPLPSPLQIFSSRGGLSLLAHYLPTVYPEQPKTQQKAPEKDKSPPVGEWVKIEPNDEIYEDVDDSMAESCSKMPIISSVPQHSLAAFGLFLKLPAYSEVLLRDKVRAQCLLRLILGVTGDGEGNDIYSLALSSSLPTLPFEVFRQLLDSSPLTTDDGVLLRRMVLEVGAVHLVLNCLSIFTHHNSTVSTEVQASATVKQPNGGTAEESIISDDKSHVYWAKGTGFGTGSTQQSWNVEQALMRQKSEEEHVTVLLQVLSSYMNPGDIIPSQCDSIDNMTYREPNSNANADLPALFLELLQQSCLIPALCSYLRNDSVLDITRHIPLYRAILQLLRALSLSNQLVQLLMKQDNDGRTSIATLLYNMKSCVDTYASRLKINKKSNLKGQTQKVSISVDDSDDEGLALLIPDIQETTSLVQSATYSESLTKDDNQQGLNSLEYPMSSTIEQKYLEIMKRLQFDTFEMIVESENGYRFTVSHHFETNVRMSGDRGHPARVKRLAQETVTLSTSLPLSYSSSVFVRCDTDRLDIMKVLITGPADTPYANGCFEFDVYFPHDYPNSPMMINLETTGRHSVRFNPNLYNDGKVCLSVLNTWHGRPEEKWNAQTSSFLQVLVSIQSLILVPEPYFNEPGFERSRGTPSGTHSSREYNSNIFQACVKWAMLEQLKNPCPCFKEVIHTHFWLKRNEICQQIENWIAELSRPQYSERGGRTITFNSMVLRRQYRQLREELAKLPVPSGIEGLEELDHPFSANITTTTATASGPTTAATTTVPAFEASQITNSVPTTSAESASDLEFNVNMKSDADKEMEIVELSAETPGSPDKDTLNEVFKSSLKNLNDFMAAEAKILDSSILDIEDVSSDTDDFLQQMNESALDTLIDDVMKTHKKLDNMVEDISE